MSIVDTMKKAASEGIKVSPEQHERFGKVLDGAQVVMDIAKEVHDEMSPDDDSPYVLTATEGMFLALEKLGLKLGN